MNKPKNLQQRLKQFKNILRSHILKKLDLQSENQKYKITYLGNRFRHWNKWVVERAKKNQSHNASVIGNE